MAGQKLRVALIRDVFFDDPAGDRLESRLRRARREGAELAVLPELPLNAWCPIRPDPADEDAEDPAGPRQQRMARAAEDVGIGLLGGAIIRSPRSGRRYNTALLYDDRGGLLGSYCKIHLPDEEGFWEARHYEPGFQPPQPIHAGGLSFGVQVCSDVQRPQGTQLLAAAGADAVLVPRSTEAATYDRWRLVLQANAMTAAVYVLSVNRPRPEGPVTLGGPSVAIGPDGRILLETTDTVAVIDLDRGRVRAARQGYPGYLDRRADLYAAGWSRLATEVGRGDD